MVVHLFLNNNKALDFLPINSIKNGGITLPTIDALIADLDTRLPDGIRWLAPTLTSAQIPYSTDKIPAGFPSPAEPYVSDYIDFNEYLVQNQAATFTARSGGLFYKGGLLKKQRLTRE